MKEKLIVAVVKTAIETILASEEEISADKIAEMMRSGAEQFMRAELERAPEKEIVTAPKAAVAKRKYKPRKSKPVLQVQPKRKPGRPKKIAPWPDLSQADNRVLEELNHKIRQEVGAEVKAESKLPPLKKIPNKEALDANRPKVDADTYQPSREDDTEGKAGALPWLGTS